MYFKSRAMRCISMALTLVNFLAVVKCQTGPRVDLGYATYEGKSLLNGVNQFLGVRYATPPLGELRWRVPVEPEQVSGIQSAVEFPPFCISLGPELHENQAEDCLFAHIWTPSNASRSSRLPVWLFIHGGGFFEDSTHGINGSDIVENSGGNIVMMTFNYRLGIFGFLASKEVRENGVLNTGLQDQRFLLKWVQKHITEFGGDPERVIIHGMSAGGSSVVHHLTAYGGRDDKLFAGAIGESFGFAANSKMEDYRWQFESSVARAGCQDAKDTMDCLRSRDTETLQLANTPAPFPGTSTEPRWYWFPCLDGNLVPDLPALLLERGQFVKVPLMVGWDTDEGSFWPPDPTTKQAFKEFIHDGYPTLNNQTVDLVADMYPSADFGGVERFPGRSEWFGSSSAAYGETFLICPAVTMARLFVHYGVDRTWAYHHNVFDQNYYDMGLGIPHCAEFPSIFGPTMLDYPIESYFTYNAPMVPIVMNYFISFVRSLDPNPKRDRNAPAWDPWGVGGNQMLLELNKSRMQPVSDGRLERCSFWHSVAEDLSFVPRT